MPMAGESRRVLRRLRHPRADDPVRLQFLASALGGLAAGILALALLRALDTGGDRGRALVDLALVAAVGVGAFPLALRRSGWHRRLAAGLAAEERALHAARGTSAEQQAVRCHWLRRTVMLASAPAVLATVFLGWLTARLMPGFSADWLVPTVVATVAGAAALAVPAWLLGRHTHAASAVNVTKSRTPDAHR